MASSIKMLDKLYDFDLEKSSKAPLAKNLSISMMERFKDNYDKEKPTTINQDKVL
jgi:hypothetical protein